MAQLKKVKRMLEADGLLADVTGGTGTLFSVTDVAAACKVSRAAIFNWLEKGLLWGTSTTLFSLEGRGTAPTPLFTTAELDVAKRFAAQQRATRGIPHTLPLSESESPVDK